MTGHQHFQKSGSVVRSEQMIMCRVGRLWVLGREGNPTGGTARSLGFTWGVVNTGWVFEK